MKGITIQGMTKLKTHYLLPFYFRLQWLICSLGCYLKHHLLTDILSHEIHGKTCEGLGGQRLTVCVFFPRNGVLPLNVMSSHQKHNHYQNPEIELYISQLCKYILRV